MNWVYQGSPWDWCGETKDAKVFIRYGYVIVHLEGYHSIHIPYDPMVGVGTVKKEFAAAFSG